MSGVLKLVDVLPDAWSMTWYGGRGRDPGLHFTNILMVSIPLPNGRAPYGKDLKAPFRDSLA